MRINVRANLFPYIHMHTNNACTFLFSSLFEIYLQYITHIIKYIFLKEAWLLDFFPIPYQQCPYAYVCVYFWKQRTVYIFSMLGFVTGREDGLPVLESVSLSHGCFGGDFFLSLTSDLIWLIFRLDLSFASFLPDLTPTQTRFVLFSSIFKKLFC